jgi:hypothetical protein
VREEGLVITRDNRPNLRELVRVVAIGQSQEHKDLLVSLLSLEVYKDGCLLLVLIQSHPAEFPPSGHMPEFADFPVLASDDRGGQYTVHPSLCGQLTEPKYREVRASWLWESPLDPEARSVRIEIPAVVWQVRIMDDTRQMQMIPGDHIPGPWVFTFAV